MVGAPDGDLAGEERDQPLPPSRGARSGAPLAWQIATASASAAWSGRGSSVSAAALDHPLDLALLGPAGAADGGLDLLRRVGRARQPALAGREDDDAARLADGERRAGVRAEVEVLDRERLRRVRVEQLAHARVDRRQPRAGVGAGAAVSITPPSSATSRPPRRATTP